MRMNFALVAGITGLLGLGACYQEYQPATTPAPYFQPEPVVVQGPPGGEIDPGYAYGGSTGEMGQYGGNAYGTPCTDPQSPGYVMGTVTDAEIDTTLEGYGYWVEDETYGRIWRPDATVVGVDFTPYETCGTWLWTDYGWTYSCDWDWGWLPFHYGNWGWFDDYWAWVPDYTWSPGWVEWRTGGGYVGWRPLGPQTRDHRQGSGSRVRDHRNNVADRGPIVRDHRGRRTGEADWRFVGDRDFAAGRRIRPSLVHNAVGLSTTSIVARPPVRASSPSASSRVTDIMKNRAFARADRFNNTPGYRPGSSTQGYAPSRGYDRRPPTQSNPGWTQPSRGHDRRPPTQSNPGWTQPSRGYDGRPPTQSNPGWTQPSRGYDRRPPTQSNPGWTQPSRGYDRAQPSRTYTPMTPSSPSRSWQQPSRTYTPMTPSSPARSWSPPSGGSSRTYSPSSSGSSRSSSPSSSGGSHRASPSSSSGSSHRASPSSSSGSSHRASPSSSSGGGRRR
ncbi:MAG: hypothetical protein M4D80_27200 [Myxococcota bacterium]|nr:hypothetical protein [Myxococcota bacterium]